MKNRQTDFFFSSVIYLKRNDSPYDVILASHMKLMFENTAKHKECVMLPTQCKQHIS